MKVFSYGGGVQSTAVLVLAAQEKIDYRVFLFCNVGVDSENPGTLAYLKQVAMPYAQQHGINLIELQKHRRNGEVDTVYERLTRPGSRSIGIPIRMANGAPGNRTCTVDFKVLVVARWLKRHGATKETPATVGLGISLDEWHRMRMESGIEHERLDYPLIDLRLDRSACVEIIHRAGLPIPPKSSYWFCPFHSIQAWQDMRHQQPELFSKAVALEQLINRRRDALGKDHVWFTNKLKPLEKATTDLEQHTLFDTDSLEVCESGYCMV
jgi:hypothetical protein